MMTLDDGHVTTIAVDPEWHQQQDRHPPAALRSRAKAIARGAKSLTLGSAHDQQRGAQDMYRKFGFVPVGVRKNYYQEVNEDAIVMWAHDVDLPAYAELLDSIERQLPAADARSSGSRRRATRPRPRSSRTAHRVLSSVVSSQVDLHARFGGVVPEIASRAHVELDHRGDRRGAGGVGRGARGARRGRRVPRARASRARCSSGVSAAKAIALAADIPYVGVNHLEAHLYAAWLEEPDLEPPLAVLLVSGGHTMVVVMEGHGRYRVVGETVDDAAGEAFDKVARLPRPRLSGWAGDRPARDRGRPGGGARSRGRCPATRDFSFAGLKTAVVNHVRRHPDARGRRRRGVVPGGGRRPARGEAARGRRRGRRADPRARRRGGGELAAARAVWPTAAEATGRRAFLPPRELCTDNGAMIAAAAWWRFQADGPTPLDAGADPNLRLPES